MYGHWYVINNMGHVVAGPFGTKEQADAMVGSNPTWVSSWMPNK